MIGQENKIIIIIIIIMMMMMMMMITKNNTKSGNEWRPCLFLHLDWLT